MAESSSNITRRLIMVGVAIAAIGAIVIMVLFIAGYWGRSPSRVMGRGARQVIGVPNMKEFVSLSMYKDGPDTVKDVTFLATDDYLYTAEFRDRSLTDFGTIRWVPADHSSSLIRSRAISRWTSIPVNLKLPEDCAEVLQVVVVEEEDGRVKNLIYKTFEGDILGKEYRDGFLERNFAGWLEVAPR